MHPCAAGVVRGDDRRDLSHALCAGDLPAVERPDLVPERAAGVVRGVDRRDLSHALCAGHLPAERGPGELPFRPDRIVCEHDRCDISNGMPDRHDNGNNRLDEHQRLSYADTDYSRSMQAWRLAAPGGQEWDTVQEPGRLRELCRHRRAQSRRRAAAYLIDYPQRVPSCRIPIWGPVSSEHER